MGDRQRRGGVAEEIGDAVARVVRVHRDVGRAALEHGEQRHDHLRRAGHQQRDGPLRARAPGDQGAGEPVGALVQLGVGEGLLLEHHRRRAGRPGGLLLDQGGQGRPGDRGLGGVVAGDLPGVLLGSEQGDVVDAGPGRRQLGAEHGEVVVRHPPYAVLVVEVPAVDEAADGGFGSGLEVRFEVEAGDAVLDLQEADVQSGRAGPLAEIEVVAHDLEDRVEAGVAVGGQLLHHPAEGRLLVGLRGQQVLVRASLEFGERRTARHPVAQRHRVHEEPDDALELLTGPVGDGRADDDVLLAGVAVQQDVERGEQHAERGDPVASAHHLQLSLQVVRERGQERGALEGGPGRAGAVGGNPQNGQLAGEFALPVVDLAAQLAAHERLLLPAGVVRVTEREGGQGGGRAGDAALVELPELPREEALRPAVGDDVVEVEEEVVAAGAGAGPEHGGPQQRPLGQVERDLRRVRHPAQDLRLHRFGRGARDVGARDVERERGGDPQHRSAVLLAEDGPQHLVPVDQVLECAAQRVEVERAVDAQGERDVVGGVAAVQPVQEPQLALGAGGGQRSFAVHPADRVVREDVLRGGEEHAQELGLEALGGGARRLVGGVRGRAGVLRCHVSAPVRRRAPGARWPAPGRCPPRGPRSG